MSIDKLNNVTNFVDARKTKCDKLYSIAIDTLLEILADDDCFDYITIDDALIESNFRYKNTDSDRPKYEYLYEDLVLLCKSRFGTPADTLHKITKRVQENHASITHFGIEFHVSLIINCLSKIGDKTFKDMDDLIQTVDKKCNFKPKNPAAASRNDDLLTMRRWQRIYTEVLGPVGKHINQPVQAPVFKVPVIQASTHVNPMNEISTGV